MTCAAIDAGNTTTGELIVKRFYGSAAVVTLIVASLLSGCATIFKGSTEQVSFSSSPDQAKLYINGQYMGETPFKLNLTSKERYTIEFRKEGYQSKTILINNNVGAGWIVLDVIGGLIPVIIDAATGNWMYLDQTQVNAALEKQQ